MLATILVNYKNDEKTISFAKNELNKIFLPNIIIIVNNSATAKSNQFLIENLNAELINDIEISPSIDKPCYIISHPENLGFAKGNNLGAKFVTTHFDISHILFTNNDIHFIDSNVVEVLISKLDSLNNAIVMIGPRVLGLEGQNQSPEPYYSFWNRYFWMYWATPLLRSNQKIKLFKMDYPDNATEGIHYKVMGSFFIIYAQDFINCGMMDPKTFLYAEEVILSERLKKINKSIYYYPSVSVLHEHGQTTSKYLNYKQMQYKRFASESYYYQYYKGVSRISILIGKISLMIYLKLKSTINQKIH
jgi:GT2 family glycosyltransferase